MKNKKNVFGTPPYEKYPKAVVMLEERLNAIEKR